jgi:predicted SnoaL-like aldol condensation-catalyzing enzyme
MALSLAFFAVLSLIIYGIIITSVLSQSQQTVFAQQRQPLRQKPSEQQQQLLLQSNSLEVNKLLIKSFVQEVFNKHNLTALDKYYAPNIIQHNPMAGQGRQGSKQFFIPFFSAFQDVHATIEHILAENSVVLVFLNWTGTHKGQFQGIPATNKPINMTTADLFRIDDTNSTIVEHWNVVDSLNLLKQIGAVTSNQSNAKK